MDSFAEGETMYDIGANLGMYTIYAAVMRKARVYAFEPEALNYAELNKNIYLNGLHEQVLAYCVALSDIDKADQLLLSDFGYGISYHDFQENSWAGDMAFSRDWVVKKEGRRPQGAIGRRLDTLVTEGLPVPAHIKIDVDGLEHRVVGGMIDVLRRPEVRTVLVEVNFSEAKNLQLIDRICELGWRFSWKQLCCNRKVKFTVEQIRKYQREGKGGLNYVFYKDAFYDRFFDEYYERYVPASAAREPPAEAQNAQPMVSSQEEIRPPPAAEAVAPNKAPPVSADRTADGEDILWLSPVADVRKQVEEHRWLAPQGPIRFELSAPAAGFLDGWVLIRSRLSPGILDGSAGLLAIADTDRVSIGIPVSKEGYVFELVELPPRTCKLLWQPSLGAGEFLHTPILMRKVGAVERRWMMARRVAGYWWMQSPERKKTVGLSLWRSLVDLAGQYRACGKLRSYAHQTPLEGTAAQLTRDDFIPE
jgi:FkbM family methyltransferase